MKKTIGTLIGIGIALTIVFAGFASSETLTVVSDTSVKAYGPITAYAPVGDAAWGSADYAAETWVHSSWPWKTDPDGAKWISTSYYTEEPVAASTWRWFKKSFELCSGAYDLSGSIDVTSDNAEDVYLNGVLVGSDGEVQDPWYDNYEWNTVLTYDLTSALQPGKNVLNFIVRNYPGSSSPTSNPTGLIFNASIQYSCPIPVSIDIKPGSSPNCFNSDGNGVIPVAILGSAGFDASSVDPFSVLLDGSAARVKGKSGNAGSLQDVNGDGYLDLVVQIIDSNGYLPGDTIGILEGATYGGVHILGSDSICIRPPVSE